MKKVLLLPIIWNSLQERVRCDLLYKSRARTRKSLRRLRLKPQSFGHRTALALTQCYKTLLQLGFGFG